MDATARSAADSQSRAGFFTAPICLYTPADLERDFSISKTSVNARAGQRRCRGNADDEDDIERLMTQTTISSSYGEAGAGPPSPIGSGTALLDSDASVSSSFETPMYSNPVVSACTASKDGAFVAAVAGHLLIVWRWTSKAWRLDMRAKLPEKVKYLGVVLIRSNVEVVVAGSDGVAYAVQRATGNPITSMQHVQAGEAGQGGHQHHHASYYAINSMKVSPRENFLATCGGDGRTIIWDTASKLPLLVAKLEPRESKAECRLPPRQAALLRPETRALLEDSVRLVDSVYDCDVSPDEQWLASGGESDAIDLWSLRGIKPMQEAQAPSLQSLRTPERRLAGGHDGARISALTFSPSGSTLASADVKGYVVIWDMDMASPVMRIQAHSLMVTSLVFVPGEDDVLISGGSDSFIHVWRLKAGMATDLHHINNDAQKEGGYRKGVVAGTSSSSSRSGGNGKTATSLSRLPDLSLRGHDSGVTHLCCFRRGGLKKRPAAGGGGTLRATSSNLSAMDPYYDLSSTTSSSVGGDETVTTSLCLLSGGVDQRLWVWGLGGEALVQHRIALALPIHVYYRGKQPNETAVSHAAMSPSTTLLATTRYQDIHAFVWEMEGARAGHLCHVLNGHQRAITSLAFANHDEAMLAAGDEGGRVCVWRLRGRGRASVSEAAQNMARPTSSMYTQANLPWLKGTAAGQGAPLGMEGRQTGFLEPESVWNDHSSGIRSVSFGQDDQHLISCDTISHIRVMDVSTREVLYTITGGDPVVGPVRFLLLTTTTTSAAAAAEPFVVATSSAEVLVWRARSGEVYSRLALAEDEHDVILDMDCRWTTTATTAASTTLDGCHGGDDVGGGLIHVCACTMAGNLAVWALAATDANQSSQCWLETSRARPMGRRQQHPPLLRLKGISFHDDSCQRVVAWGLNGVAVWSRVVEVAREESADQRGAAVVLDEIEEWDRPGTPTAAATTVTADMAVSEAAGSCPGPSSTTAGLLSFELVGARQMGEAEFMKGCCLARQLGGAAGTLRLVLKEGWVIDRAPLGQEEV